MRAITTHRPRLVSGLPHPPIGGWDPLRLSPPIFRPNHMTDGWDPPPLFSLPPLCRGAAAGPMPMTRDAEGRRDRGLIPTVPHRLSTQSPSFPPLGSRLWVTSCPIRTHVVSSHRSGPSPRSGAQSRAAPNAISQYSLHPYRKQFCL